MLGGNDKNQDTSNSLMQLKTIFGQYRTKEANALWRMSKRCGIFFSYFRPSHESLIEEGPCRSQFPSIFDIFY